MIFDYDTELKIKKASLIPQVHTDVERMKTDYIIIATGMHWSGDFELPHNLTLSYIDENGRIVEAGYVISSESVKEKRDA